jgi:hypothetical protein
MARYPDAEAVLLDARNELETSSTPARSDSNAILTRLVELYEKWGRHDTAVRYRAQLIP